MAEYLAYRAISYACLGDTERCGISAADARRLHGTSVETITLASCAEAIAAVVAKRNTAADLAAAAYTLVRSTGGFDALVVASRACPGLLEFIAEQKDSHEELNSVLSRSNDFQLGRHVGITLSSGPVGPLSQLTKREVEVAELVALGLTNRAIGNRLFISESTAKAHVRHILEKLNATKRTEIAARVASS